MQSTILHGCPWMCCTASIPTWPMLVTSKVPQLHHTCSLPHHAITVTRHGLHQLLPCLVEEVHLRWLQMQVSQDGHTVGTLSGTIWHENTYIDRSQGLLESTWQSSCRPGGSASLSLQQYRTCSNWREPGLCG